MESGVRGSFETTLNVSLTAEDGTACKQYSTLHLLLTLILSFPSKMLAVSSDVSIPDPFEMVFTPGQTSSNSCIAIPIISDKDVEGDQYFSISISSAGTPPNVSIGSPSAVYITIVDNDKSNDIMENDNDITVNTTDDGKFRRSICSGTSLMNTLNIPNVFLEVPMYYV